MLNDTLPLQVIESKLQKTLAAHKLLEDVTSFDELIFAIDGPARNDAKPSYPGWRLFLVGADADAAFNAYANYFFKRFSSPYQNSLWDRLGLRIRWTDQSASDNFGIENCLIDELGNRVLTQSNLSAFCAGEEFLIDGEDVANFVFTALTCSVPASHRVLFTSQPGDQVFRKGWEAGYQQMRVLGSDLQRDFVESDPMFFSDFRRELAKRSDAASTKLEKISKLRSQLDEMEHQYNLHRVLCIKDLVENL